jgi:hypothetical protein
MDWETITFVVRASMMSDQVVHIRRYETHNSVFFLFPADLIASKISGIISRPIFQTTKSSNLARYLVMSCILGCYPGAAHYI